MSIKDKPLAKRILLKIRLSKNYRSWKILKSRFTSLSRWVKLLAVISLVSILSIEFYLNTIPGIQSSYMEIQLI